MTGTRTQDQRLKRALIHFYKNFTISGLCSLIFLLLHLLLSNSSKCLLRIIWEKRLSPRRAPRRSLLPHSPRRTQVRLKPLLPLPGLRQIYIEPTGVLRRKSAVCGLNGHRLYYLISLLKVTYKSTIQVSRNFHALFTKTLENSDTCD